MIRKGDIMFEFTYTYVLPVTIYLFAVLKYISFKEGNDGKIPFK
jgi:hypothetical protein